MNTAKRLLTAAVMSAALESLVWSQTSDVDPARKMFTPDITRAILSGAIPPPAGFDKAMAEHIGMKRLDALRSGDEMVQGRDYDLAGWPCHLRLTHCPNLLALFLPSKRR